MSICRDQKPRASSNEPKKGTMAHVGGNDVLPERRGAVIAFRSSSVMEGPFPREVNCFKFAPGQVWK